MSGSQRHLNKDSYNGVDEDVFVLCCVAMIFLKSAEFKLRKNFLMWDNVDNNKTADLI